MYVVILYKPYRGNLEKITLGRIQTHSRVKCGPNIRWVEFCKTLSRTSRVLLVGGGTCGLGTVVTCCSEKRR